MSRYDVEPDALERSFLTPEGAIREAREACAFVAELSRRPAIVEVLWSDTELHLVLEVPATIVFRHEGSIVVEWVHGRAAPRLARTLPLELSLHFGKGFTETWHRERLPSLMQSHRVVRVQNTHPLPFVYVRGLSPIMLSPLRLSDTGERLLHWCFAG